MQKWCIDNWEIKDNLAQLWFIGHYDVLCSYNGKTGLIEKVYIVNLITRNKEVINLKSDNNEQI